MISGRPRLLAVGIPELHRAAAEDAEKALGRWSDFGSLQTQVGRAHTCPHWLHWPRSPCFWASKRLQLTSWVGWSTKSLNFFSTTKTVEARKETSKPHLCGQITSRSWRGSQANHMDRSRPFGCGFQANQILAMDDLTQVGSMQNKMHLHRSIAKLSRGGTCSGGRLVGGTSNAVSATLHPWARLGCQMVKHCGACFQLGN